MVTGPAGQAHMGRVVEWQHGDCKIPWEVTPGGFESAAANDLRRIRLSWKSYFCSLTVANFSGPFHAVFPPGRESGWCSPLWHGRQHMRNTCPGLSAPLNAQVPLTTLERFCRQQE